MNKLLDLVNLHVSLGSGLDRLRSLLLLGTRLWVSWQFWVSGWLKVTNWDTTLELFRSEYHVPLLPPTVAAVTGAFGELFFPTLLVLGLFTRVGALGLFAVNAMALYSYWHVLGQEGFEAARGQHYLWGFMALVILTCGAGFFSVDTLLEKRSAARCRPKAAVSPMVAA
jgi:putative oxidoreductase